jgi:hypothetical protein
MNSTNKNPSKELAETLADYEMDREEKGMSVNKYYLLKIKKLTKEFPEKPFGSTFVPNDVKQVPIKSKMVYMEQTNRIHSAQ